MEVNSASDTVFVPTKPVAKTSELNMETFLRLLTVQLANQNPLEPMNDRDFFAQMAQLGQVQGMDALNKQGQIEQAQTLMGKEVTAVRPGALSNSTEPLVSGVVRKLSIVNGEYKISIEEANGGIVQVDLKSIQTIKPQLSIKDYAYLMGKEIAGTESSVAVSGKATGLSVEDGNVLVELTNAAGVKSQLSVGNISSIKE